MDDLSKECAFLLTSIILLDKSVRPILFQDSWIFIGDFSAFSFLHLLDSAIRWTIIYENFIIYLSVHLKYLINYPRIFIHSSKKFHQFTTAAQNKTTSFCSLCSSLKIVNLLVGGSTHRKKITFFHEDLPLSNITREH